jgi:hypothetical protein
MDRDCPKKPKGPIKAIEDGALLAMIKDHGLEGFFSLNNSVNAIDHEGYQSVRPSRRRTCQPSGGVSGAMVVPTDEGSAAETPSAEDPDAIAMDQETNAADVEMDFVGHVGASQGIGSFEPSFDDMISELLLTEMGSSGRLRRKDGRTAIKKIVSEIYSPPRVTKILSGMLGHALAPGLALDLTCTDPYGGLPWDFDTADKRERARKLFREQRPVVLIGSPMCTAWSTWQRLNKHKRDPEVVAREMVKSRVHLVFTMELYREQLEEGRLFIHEHPLHAASWMEECVQELLACKDVGRIHADQCQYDLEVMHGGEMGAPLKKPTGFMSNGPEILEALSRVCTGRNGTCSRRKGGRHG